MKRVFDKIYQSWTNQVQKIHLNIYRQAMQLVIFLPTFNVLCMRLKIWCDGYCAKFFRPFWPCKRGLREIQQEIDRSIKCCLNVTGMWVRPSSPFQIPAWALALAPSFWWVLTRRSLTLRPPPAHEPRLTLTGPRRSRSSTGATKPENF
jgi:hypothetical protein